MLRNFQSGPSTQQPPPWLRLIALMCVLVICIASTVQVCHSHPAASSNSSKDSPQNAPGPDHCPLSVAMHSALPASLNTSAEPVLEIQRVLFKAVELTRLRRWSFELFSRPPPAVSSRA